LEEIVKKKKQPVEEQKVEEVHPSEEIKTREDKQKKAGYDLPPVSMKKHGGVFDNDLLKD
jgi:hypothetical protein